VDGFLNLPLAGVIIGFHSVWSGIPVVLTLVGWCLLIKSLTRFCAPKQALRIMAQVSVERALGFQVAGAALVGLAGLWATGSTLASVTPELSPTPRRVYRDAVEQGDGTLERVRALMERGVHACVTSIPSGTPPERSRLPRCCASASTAAGRPNLRPFCGGQLA
jgi:hypothetical protein